VQKLSATVS